MVFCFNMDHRDVAQGVLSQKHETVVKHVFPNCTKIPDYIFLVFILANLVYYVCSVS